MTDKPSAARSISIDASRLLEDLNTLRRFGAQGGCVVRLSYSAADQQARQWLAERMSAAGLEVSIDGVGNVIGLSPRRGPALLMGSHSDTQPQGGWLDGALGVVYGLEIARSLTEQYPGWDAPAVDIASWIDEEGTFLNFLGSRSFCDALTETELAAAKSAAGEPLRDAITRAGYDASPRMRLEPSRYLGYFEGHIEQGGRLEATAKRIGVVTAIVGAREYRLEFAGEQNHAGTTPMTLRKDAAMALFRFSLELDAAFRAVTDDAAVWTLGRIHIEPNASSIVPGCAHLYVQFRDTREAVLMCLEEILYNTVALCRSKSTVGIRVVEETIRLAPTQMDGTLLNHVRQAAEALAPGQWMDMPSGAGHDAQILRRRMPAAMLFIPSLGGISHSFAEDSRPADIVLGCEVAADAVARMLLT